MFRRLFTFWSRNKTHALNIKLHLMSFDLNALTALFTFIVLVLQSQEKTRRIEGAWLSSINCI